MLGPITVSGIVVMLGLALGASVPGVPRSGNLTVFELAKVFARTSMHRRR